MYHLVGTFIIINDNCDDLLNLTWDLCVLLNIIRFMMKDQPRVKTNITDIV
jgi:hypothetical protein